MATNPFQETDMSKHTFMDRNPELRMLIAQSDLSPTQLQTFTASIITAYDTYSTGLPDTSAWKTGKLEHVKHGADEVREHGALFGLQGKEIDVMVLLVSAHDTGRLVHEHVKNAIGKLPTWRHGVESAHIAKHAFGEHANTRLCLAMFDAIEHHSDIETPKLVEFHGDKAGYALTCLLRDFDKLTGFEDATRYTADEEFKRKQILTNFSTQRAEKDPETGELKHPTWGDEKGKIVPEGMLDTFLAGKALVRRDCQSYEAYMAQYLAWTFDIQNPEALELSVKRGGPKVVYDYLLAQTKEGAPEQYAKLKAWGEAWQGGVLTH